MEAVGFLEANKGKEIYPHSLFAVGVPVDGGLGKIVLIHVLMGEARFEFRMTPENARRTAEALIAAARYQEDGTPMPEVDPVG